MFAFFVSTCDIFRESDGDGLNKSFVFPLKKRNSVDLCWTIESTPVLDFLEVFEIGTGYTLNHEK
jgi:hypothetical protein